MLNRGRGKVDETPFFRVSQGRVRRYALVRVEGEDHRQQFTVSCRVAEKQLVREGSGSSRRKAEQDAAAAVLEVMDDGN